MDEMEVQHDVFHLGIKCRILGKMCSTKIIAIYDGLQTFCNSELRQQQYELVQLNHCGGDASKFHFST